MKYSEQKIRKELHLLAEEKYREFVSALIPGCDTIIGVRIPTLRKIAKRITKENPFEYLENADEIYFEEKMIKGLIIGNIKTDIEIILEQASLFIPKVDNWSLCDSFCSEFKIVRKHKERVWQFLQPYYHSKNPYEVRVAVVMLLFHFTEGEYLEKIFAVLNGITNNDYYVKMAVAWAVSIFFIKFPDTTLLFLQENDLDDETHNKALQKIRESRRVDKETKESIKKMKR